MSICCYDLATCPQYKTTSSAFAQLGGFAFIGEGIPIGLGAAYKIKYRRVRQQNYDPTRNLALVHTPSLSAVSLAVLHASSLDCGLLLQEALHDEKADQVAVNFFGDGTANNGATVSSQSYSMHSSSSLSCLVPHHKQRCLLIPLSLCLSIL